jgi:uncharacterized tellurite resistance protein B-like protein
MGLFDNLFKVNQTRVTELKLSSNEAFFGIVFSAMLADDEISKSEMDNLLYLVTRFKGFRGITANLLTNMMSRFDRIIKKEGVGTIIAAAKSSLDINLRETAFANAVEIVLADGIVDQKEKEFLEQLQVSVGISDELAEKIIDVMIIKNRGTIADIFQDVAVDNMFV